VYGLAASMATVVLMACRTIYMPTNAMMMIHKPWGIQGGDADDLRRFAELLDKMEAPMVAAYAEKSGKSEDDIRAMLKQETWMTGEEAVAAGFADQVLDPLTAAATLKSQRMQEFTNMPEHVQAFFAPRGQATPPATPPVVPQAPAAPVALTPDQIRAQVMAEETQRRTDIQAAFGGFAAAHGDLLATCLGDMNCTADSARQQLLAKLGAGTTPSAPQAPRAHIFADNGNIVGDSVRASISARLGQAEMQADNAYNYMSLRELARASLQDRGIGVASLNPMNMVGLAFTHSSSDFGNILLDVSHRSLLQGWEDAPETFQRWTLKGQLSDFKTARRVGLGEFPSLREVRPGAEYKHITLGDRGEAIMLATYGELFSITRQAIINDDLSVLSEIPRKMGIAARATIGDLVYAVLTSNAKMADGKALFHADRKNLVTGTPSVLSIDALSAGKTAMATQKTQTEGGKSRTLNIRPAFLLVPVALEDKANQLIRSASVPTAQVNAGIDNPVRNMAEVIGEPRLDDASATAWYLAARQGSDTIEVAYLNGVDTPYLEQQEGFTSDGVASKVRIDAGVAPRDFRGLYSAAGK
jgi:hypothetical protein